MREKRILVSAFLGIGHTVESEIVRGMIAYALARKDWRFRLVRGTSLTDILRGEQPVDGIVGLLVDPGAVALALRRGIPTVSTADVLSGSSVPLVCEDDYAIGQMVAADFLRRGFRHFAVYRHAHYGFAMRRAKGFQDTVRGEGFACACYITKQRVSAMDLPAPGSDPRLVAWTRSLPKPVAVFAVNDHIGSHFLQECRHAGIHVPEEVAVIAVDNDEIFCQLALPPLSSVETPGASIGYRAAEVLDRMLRGGAAPRRPIRIPPVRIVTRQSSDILAVDDKATADVLRHIREHAHECGGVKGMMQALGRTDRRALERKFKSLIGRGPGAELLRVRIERAKELLGATVIPVEQVARLCGFTLARHFSLTFRRKVGESPSAFRRRTHAGPAG